MSELTVRQHIQSIAQGADVFSNDDVTLNDWSILDQVGALEAAPFLIILGSEQFSATWASMTGPETQWDVNGMLFEGWDKDWPVTLEAFLASRQSLIDAFNGASARTPSGEYVDIGEIRAGGPIVEYEQGDLTYMAQPIIWSVEEHT